MFGRAKGKDLILDKDCLAHEDVVFLLEHGFDASLLYKERSKRMSNLKLRYDDAVRNAGDLEDRIRTLEAENTELKARAAASRHDGTAEQTGGAAAADALSARNAQLADENRKLSEAKADLHAKILELSRQTQDLRQKLTDNGGKSMNDEITQWEYKVQKIGAGSCSTEESLKILNQLGAEGWKMTNTQPPLGGTLFIRKKTKTTDDDYGYGR